MLKSGKFTVIIGGALTAISLFFFFQNCAKSKFVDPDPRHSVLALGICKVCSDESGTGLNCRENINSAFAGCHYESCNSGYQMNLQNQCVPVVCTPGAIANCAVDHGEGRKTCNENSQGYGACSATDCESGFVLLAGQCITETPFCIAESHRDCSTDSTFGVETCNAQGTTYDACVFGDCKPGYNRDGGEACVLNACTPEATTPCTVGAAAGLQTCNSAGSGWSSCEINGCQQGYVLKDGVCVVQICTPGSEYVCEFAHGSGIKICNNDGTDYGQCNLLGCQNGYTLENSQCHEQVCVPSSASSCIGESGTGIKYCYENGLGHKPCELNSCDSGFTLKNGQCVAEDSCDDDETSACTQQFGTGVRECNPNSHKLGPCSLTACNTGYQLVNQGGSNACKKIK